MVQGMILKNLVTFLLYAIFFQAVRDHGSPQHLSTVSLEILNITYRFHTVSQKKNEPESMSVGLNFARISGMRSYQTIYIRTIPLVFITFQPMYPADFIRYISTRITTGNSDLFLVPLSYFSLCFHSPSTQYSAKELKSQLLYHHIHKPTF